MFGIGHATHRNRSGAQQEASHEYAAAVIILRRYEHRRQLSIVENERRRGHRSIFGTEMHDELLLLLKSWAKEQEEVDRRGGNSLTRNEGTGGYDVNQGNESDINGAVTRAVMISRQPSVLLTRTPRYLFALY